MRKKQNADKHTRRTKFLSTLLSAVMLGSAFVTTGTATFSMNTVPVSAAPLASEYDYDIMATTQEGLILHAWDWSFKNITANMENIAKAGYTSIQTSPIQLAKESTLGKSKQLLVGILPAG